MLSGSIRLGLMVTFAALAGMARAEEWRIDPAASTVAMTYYEIKTPRHCRFDSISGVFDVDLDNPAETTGELIIRIDSFDADDIVRERIFKSPAWLDAGRFPEARYRVDRMQTLDDGRFLITGNMTLRDRTVPVSFTAEVSRTARTLRAAGAFSIPRSRFDLRDSLTESLVAIGDDVELAFDLVARRPQ